MLSACRISPAHFRRSRGGLTSKGYGYQLKDDGTAVIQSYAGASDRLNLPADLDGHPVTAVGIGAFRDDPVLRAVILPEGIVEIGGQAFYNCTGLTEITLPSSLKTIGDLAFSYCESLEGVLIRDGVTTIGEYAFGDCGKLRGVSVPQSVASIGTGAFDGTAGGFVLYGLEGSYAQEYAKTNGLTFAPMDGTAWGLLTATRTPGLNEATPTPNNPPPATTVTVPATVHFPHADRDGMYTGEMANGVLNGQGTFAYTPDSGVSWTYEGAWENGGMNGQGTLSWSDGLACRGSFRDSQPYEGEWLIDDAVVYTGGFRMLPDSGLIAFHGQGKLTNRLGRVIYEGSFDSGYLSETADQRSARAQILDSQCESLSNQDYAALMNAADGGAGKLVKLTGRVGKILLDQEQGTTEFLLINNGSGACPIHIRYQYGAGEEKAQTGRQVTVWGTVTGVFSFTDNRGIVRYVPEVDADVTALNGDKPQLGASLVALTAAKALDGRALADGEFSFELCETYQVLEERVSPLDGTTNYVTVTYTKQLQVKANDVLGLVLFDPIGYTTADIGGIYTYTITEVPSLEVGMTCDPMVLEVTVLIADGGNSTPAVLVIYPDDATFNNTYQAAGSVDISFDVALTGQTIKNGEFTFQLMDIDTVLQTKRNNRDGIIRFDPVPLETSAVGNACLYTVRQVPGNEPGITYDQTAKTVLVTPYDAGNGTLNATAEYPDGTSFLNAYAAPFTDPVLSRVDADRISLTAGGTVTFTPVVSMGTEPYKYSYRLLKDGAEYKASGWVPDPARTISLTSEGVYQMEVTVEDSQGRRSQAVLSQQVTVKPHVFSPADLTGTWSGSHNYTTYTGTGTTEPMPQNYECTMTLEMGEDGNGIITLSFGSFTGTATFRVNGGIFKATMNNGGCIDHYEGILHTENGTMTLSGTLRETQDNGIHSYSGTWRYTKDD